MWLHIHFMHIAQVVKQMYVDAYAIVLSMYVAILHIKVILVILRGYIITIDHSFKHCFATKIIYLCKSFMDVLNFHLVNKMIIV